MTKIVKDLEVKLVYIEVYPDIVFIINFLMDLILLNILKRVNKKSSNIRRMIGAATVGAFIACIVVIFVWMNVILRFFLMYVASSVLMVLIAFGRMKFLDLLKQVVVLYFITYFLGGFINSFYYHTNLRTNIVNLGNGILYSDFPLKYLFVTILLVLPFLLFMIWFLRWYRMNAPHTYEVELVMNERKIQTKGLMDTGNCLYDPFSRKPVMVVEDTLLEDLLTEELCQDLKEVRRCIGENEYNTGEWNINADHVLRFRFVPYRSIGKKQGIMVGLLLDKVLIHTGKETICNEKVIAAISDNELSEAKEYHVILHKELL